MKQIRLTVLIAAVCLIGIVGIACGGATPTVVPPTAAPTAAPPTAAPTQAPPTAAPTATTPPTSAAVADETVQDAFAQLSAADTFNLEANASVSPIFFQGQAAPSDEPDEVNIFTLFGEQAGPNMHYDITGFVASLIGVFAGFDPNSEELEIAEVDGERFMRGKLENETEAQWYFIPPDPNSTSSFMPQDMLEPMSKATYPESSWLKTGDEVIDGQECTIYDGTREAFDAVFPEVVLSTLLNPETISLDSIEQREYRVTVCADGNVYHVIYNFDGHAKDNEDEKGSFRLNARISDYDGTFSFTPPEDAVPFPASTGLGPTSEATPAGTPQAFSSFEGEWEGTIGEDSPFSFTVTDNAVSYIGLNYAVSSGSCMTSGFLGNSVDDGAIQSDSFSFVLTDSDDVEYTVEGEFDSNNAASGTLNIKGETFCGDTDSTFDWTASHISSPDSPAATEEATEDATEEATEEATAGATEEPTPAEEFSGGAEAVNAVFAALAANDIDSALANMSPDVIYNIAGNSGIGTEDLRSNLELAQAVGTTFRVSNVQDLGGIVTFTVTVSGFGAGTYSNSSAIVEDGKIEILTVQ